MSKEKAATRVAEITSHLDYETMVRGVRYPRISFSLNKHNFERAFKSLRDTGRITLVARR